MFFFMANNLSKVITMVHAGLYLWAKALVGKLQGWKLDEVALANDGEILVFFNTAPMAGKFVRIVDTVVTTGEFKAGTHPRDGIMTERCGWRFRRVEHAEFELSNAKSFKALEAMLQKWEQFEADSIECEQSGRCPGARGGDHTCKLAYPEA